ncbi:hypothetical protein JCM10908_006441 [Rhodotorula pacifica]|uniref:Edc3p n=1 Tax=Rhodotorula pacifica TaxID=1495444 RepID=UPI00316BCF07
MATSFLGLPVLVKLRSSPADSVQGILSSLDPASGTLTLTEARSHVGGVKRLEGIRVLGRAEVAGLELLSVQRGNEAQAEQQATTPRPSSSAQQPPLQHNQNQYPRSQLASPVPTHAHLGLTIRTPSGKSQKRRQPNRAAAGTPTRSAPQSPQPAARIDGDFDFSAGLASFDKKAIFADIKSQDATDPSSRLHAHNRNPARTRTAQSKLLPTESVLSPQELYNQQQEVQILRDNRRSKIASMTPTDMHAGDVEDGLGSADGEEQRNERRWQSVTGEIEKIALGTGFAVNGGDQFLLTAAGLPIPVVKSKQWREALSIAEIESSLSSTQRLEASSSALLQHILTRKLVALPVKPSARPTVCVLSSDSDRGYIALRAAATLAYRGCRIFVLAPAVVGGQQAASERFRTAIRVVSSAGARIIREVEDLPQSVNLVIDALDGGVSVQESIDWANSLENAFVLSPDVPSGLDPDLAGDPLPSISPILASGILAFGLPRAYLHTEFPCHPTRHRASITLADVGFPPAIWDRVGVDGYDATIWGAGMLVDLSRAKAS